MNYFSTNKEYRDYTKRVKKEFSISEVPAGYLFYIINIDGTSASVVSRKEFFENIKNKVTDFIGRNPDISFGEIAKYIQKDIYEEYKSNVLAGRYTTLILNFLIFKNQIKLSHYRKQTRVKLT